MHRINRFGVIWGIGFLCATLSAEVLRGEPEEAQPSGTRANCSFLKKVSELTADGKPDLVAQVLHAIFSADDLEHCPEKTLSVNIWQLATTVLKKSAKDVRHAYQTSYAGEAVAEIKNFKPGSDASPIFRKYPLIKEVGEFALEQAQLCLDRYDFDRAADLAWRYVEYAQFAKVPVSDEQAALLASIFELAEQTERADTFFKRFGKDSMVRLGDVKLAYSDWRQTLEETIAGKMGDRAPFTIRPEKGRMVANPKMYGHRLIFDAFTNPLSLVRWYPRRNPRYIEVDSQAGLSQISMATHEVTWHHAHSRVSQLANAVSTPANAIVNRKGKINLVDPLTGFPKEVIEPIKAFPTLATNYDNALIALPLSVDQMYQIHLIQPGGESRELTRFNAAGNFAFNAALTRTPHGFLISTTTGIRLFDPVTNLIVWQLGDSNQQQQFQFVDIAGDLAILKLSGSQGFFVLAVELSTGGIRWRHRMPTNIRFARVAANYVLLEGETEFRNIDLQDGVTHWTGGMSLLQPIHFPMGDEMGFVVEREIQHRSLRTGETTGSTPIPDECGQNIRRGFFIEGHIYLSEGASLCYFKRSP